MIVNIHESQFPERVMADLRDSLRTREVNHKFHYDSVKQTQRWLELHQAYSPSRTDLDCAATYEKACVEAAGQLPPGLVRIIGLGCGGGRKDRRLVEELRAGQRHRVEYMALDVSAPMVITACQEVGRAGPETVLPPLVCDLAHTQDLASALAGGAPVPPSGAGATCLFTFLGMIPNFEPGDILPVVARVMRREDWMLFSANLAPGTDYHAGVRNILPLYDNLLTREWLIQFLLDLGVEREDGQTQFSIEPDAAGLGLLRVVARFVFERTRTVMVAGESFEFKAGESIRLFFSYRHTPRLIQDLLGRHGLEVRKQWITRSAEEGVFLVAQAAG